MGLTLGSKKKSTAKESNVVVTRLKKEFGNRSILEGGEYPQISRIQTGIFPLDLAMGGGIPRNRSNIIYGPESSLKSTIALLTAAQFQREGQTVALVDAEHSFDPSWTQKLGVDINSLLVGSPDTVEQSIDMIQALFHALDIGLVIVDSIGAMSTANEVSSEAEKVIVGGSSALITKMMHKLNAGFSIEAKRKHYPTLIFINQNRFKIGKMFGDPETMPGGQLLRFSSSLTLRLYGKDKIVSSVNEKVPCFKTISGVIKKYRVPIVSQAFEFDLCVLPHDDLKVGEVNSWNTVSNRLKVQGDLVKDKKSWQCMGAEFDTLDAMYKRYRSDSVFSESLHARVFEKAFDMHAVPQVDKETGEIL
jgi:recombination protein RecA